MLKFAISVRACEHEKGSLRIFFERGPWRMRQEETVGDRGSQSLDRDSRRAKTIAFIILGEVYLFLTSPCVQVTGRPLADDVEAIRSPFAANMLESLPASKPR
jgi:hypothetical protein